MSGVCVKKIAHTCGTSDGLQIFQEEDGTLNGFCFRCETYVPNPEADLENIPVKHKRSPEQIEAELVEIDALQSIELPTRKLRQESLAYFGVKTGLSEVDGFTPAYQFFPYFKDGKRTGYRAKIMNPKKFYTIGEVVDAEPFGWQQALVAGGKKLFITEGENDAVALFQALKDRNRGTKWERYDPAVISLNNGATSARKVLASWLPKIRAMFEEVILVFDQDDAGKKAVEDAQQVYPTAKTVTLPGKDPNQCVIDGRSNALAEAVSFKAALPKNTRIVMASDLYAQAREQAKWGIPWPFEGLTKLTRGIRFGETYYLGAGVKMGKSELVNTLAADLIIKQDMKVFMAKPEEANRKTVQLVLGKVAGKIFHDPEVEFDYDAYDKAAALVGDKLLMLSLYQHMGWDSLRSDIMVAAQQGAKAVFIDPITNLVNGTSAGETNTVLQEIAQELAAMAKDLDIVVFIFCHLKAPVAGEPHERGGKVYSHQFSGSRAMMRSCNLMIGLEGDKNPELPMEQRNMRRLVILEDREFGATGYVDMYWDAATGLFNEVNKNGLNN